MHHTAYKFLISFLLLLQKQEPWLIGLLAFHATLLLITILSRKHVNFQLGLSVMACKFLTSLSVTLYLADEPLRFLI